MDLSRQDAIKLLEAFDLIVSGETSNNNLAKFIVAHPQPSNTVAYLKIKGNQFILVFESYFELEESYLLGQISEVAKLNELYLDMTSIVASLSGEAVTYKGKAVYAFIITSQKQRLDVTLANLHNEMSRSSLQKHIKAGHVKVNGKNRFSPSLMVSDTDVISLDISESNKKADDLPIIFQDQHVVVFNKPSGMLTHAKGGINYETTVADIARPYTSFATDTNRPGIVHRLDRATSGVIVVARTAETAKWIQKQFTDRKVEKEYVAIVSGEPEPEEAIIDLPIERNPKKPSTFRVGSGGKPSLTHYQVTKTNGFESLVKLRPKTGRTHQLRVHMQYIGHSIIGDTVYGKSKSSRLMLHAEKIALTLPGNVKKVFHAITPNEFNVDQEQL